MEVEGDGSGRGGVEGCGMLMVVVLEVDVDGVVWWR